MYDNDFVPRKQFSFSIHGLRSRRFFQEARNRLFPQGRVVYFIANNCWFFWSLRSMRYCLCPYSFGSKSLVRWAWSHIPQTLYGVFLAVALRCESSWEDV